MSRQAEAERERRARIITADGEYQASKRLAAAAEVMARDPAALQLRLLQTVVEVAGEKNSTLVMPVPVELLRFFEKMAPGPSERASATPAKPDDLGDAEVAEAEAEIAKTNLPQLDQPVVPPVPEVEPAAETTQELPSAAGAEPAPELPGSVGAEAADLPSTTVDEPDGAAEKAAAEKANGGTGARAPRRRASR
jgi:hypothetical protein